MQMIYINANVINQLYHGSAQVRAIMHSLTLVHYCIVNAHEPGTTKTYTQTLDNNHGLSITLGIWEIFLKVLLKVGN